MVLMKSSDVPSVCDKTMYGGQGAIQSLLVIVAVLCIPIMLLGKPIIVMRQQRTSHVPVSSL